VESTQATGVTVHELLGAAVGTMESDLTIPIVANAAELAAQAWNSGIHIFKIKVGDVDLDADFARVMAVHAAAPDAQIRIDANQAFTVTGALQFVERLLAAGIPLQLLEQPVPADDLDGMAQVAAHSPVPVFADESCRTPQHALLLAQTPIQGINCKINKSGIGGVLDILTIARASGKQLMLGCMLETRRSIAVALELACGTGAFDFLDLDSHLLLNEGGENPFFTQAGTKMSVMG
jgi:L-Ala-D/L-Glu epimerase